MVEVLPPRSWSTELRQVGQEALVHRTLVITGTPVSGHGKPRAGFFAHRKYSFHAAFTVSLNSIISISF